ncbi:MAG: hypothetical protein VKP70_07715 [Cyanobacteriota bacterium]|nr:hypothetical protein [Cyanobacteriota bacterium]
MARPRINDQLLDVTATLDPSGLAEPRHAGGRSDFKDLCPQNKVRLLRRLETVMAFSPPMG